MSTAYKVACCLYTNAVQLLEQNGLRVPEGGGVDHRGPSAECCDTLTVHWGNGLPGVSNPSVNPCEEPHSREFIVTYIGKACTEGEGVQPCGGASTNKCEGGDCFEPDPVIAGPDCEGERPTVAEETAAVWNIRELFEDDLICKSKCCFLDCAGIRCNSVSFSSSENVTEGGCFTVELRLNIEW